MARQGEAVRLVRRSVGVAPHLQETLEGVLDLHPKTPYALPKFKDQRTSRQCVVVGQLDGVGWEPVLRRDQKLVVEFPHQTQQGSDVREVRVVADEANKLAAFVTMRTLSIGRSAGFSV